MVNVITVEPLNRWIQFRFTLSHSLVPYNILVATAIITGFIHIVGQKGSKGDKGYPGKCSALCGESCVFGARGILQEARVGGRDVLSLRALQEAVEEGNKTARELETGLRDIMDLTEDEANRVYTYLLFRNSVCDLTLLRGGPDSEFQNY